MSRRKLRLRRERLKRVGRGLYRTSDGYEIGRMDCDGAWSVYEKGSHPSDPESLMTFGEEHRFAALWEALAALRASRGVPPTKGHPNG